MKNSGITNHVSIPIWMAVISIISMLVGMRLHESLVSDGYLHAPVSSPQKAITEASEHIRTKYYGDLSMIAYTDAVIDNMIDQLDPHSHYFKKESSVIYDRYMQGIYQGVGAEFTALEERFYIYSIVPNSPADSAGLMKGDILVSIDSIDLTKVNMSLDSLLSLRKHELGERVTLKILRPDDNRAMVPHTIDLVVGKVVIPLIGDYIISESETSKSVSYIKIKRFYRGVYKDFMKILERHASPDLPVKSLIIDLRDNPGGIVDETVKMLNQLIEEKEKLLLSTQSRLNKTKEYFSNGRTFLNIDRIVILTNDQSASASEILSGVLQDYDKAIVIGQNSYGKGLIQQNYDLSNQGSINLSIGEYILPTGRRINPSTSVDSTYRSIVNNRPLHSDRGIPVDVLLSKCIEKDRFDRLVKDVITKNKLWSKSDYQNFESFEYTDILKIYDIDEACINQISNKVKWAINSSDTQSGEKIKTDHLDDAILRAYNIIGSQKYLEILGHQ